MSSAEAVRRLKAIGLVGGLGPGATLHYYGLLARAFAEHAGPHPALYISHADPNRAVDYVSRGDADGFARYLVGHVSALSRAGADFSTVSSIMAHICVPALKDMTLARILDLVDCVVHELEARSARKVALMGTRFVMESDLYGRLGGFEVLRPSPETVEFVHANYFKIVTAQRVEGSGADIDGLKAVARDFVKRGADVVVLGGTELSLAFDEATCGFPALDCAKLHVEAIVSEAYGDAPAQSSIPEWSLK